VFIECVAPAVPLQIPGEDEVVQSGDELQRCAPVVLPDEPVDSGLVGELVPQPLVERRAPRGGADLLLEDLAPLGYGADFGAPSAALACSAITPKARGSLTARSASTFRSSSIPALLQPFTN
jgi:hypothetical protein